MPKEITLQDSQKLVLQILEFLKKICDEYDLKYYIMYGTLIGAVRHKGYIPWDDDVDVVMPRGDYNRLVEIMRNQKGRYRLVSFETNPKFTAPLPKIIDTKTELIQKYDFYERVNLGLYIDIFIADNAGDTIEEAEEFYKRSYAEYTKWYKSDLKLFLHKKSKLRSVLSFIKRLPYRLRGISHYLTQLKKISSKYENTKTNYVAITNSGSNEGKRNIFKASDFGEGVMLEFENINFRAPNEYKNLLEVEYGDYMKLPPKDKQVSHHSYELYWR